MSETRVTVNQISNTEAVEPVVAGALNATDVKSGIQAVVKLGEVIASLSGNQAVSKVVSTFSALATQDWFINLIVGASSLFDSGDHGKAAALIAGSAPEFNTSDEPVVAEALNPADVTNSIESILQVATVVGRLSGNAAVIKAVSVLGTVAREPWFTSVVVNLSSLFGK